MGKKSLEERCAFGGLELDEVTDEVEEGHFQLLGYTIGRKDEPAAHFGSEEDLEAAESIDFELWHPIPDCNAAFSKTVLEIELEVQMDGNATGPFTKAEKVLNAAPPFTFPERNDGVFATIGWASPELMFWRATSPTVHSIEETPVPVLRLAGLPSGFDPNKTLERIAAAVLYEFWRATSTHARIRRHEPWTIFFGPPVHKATGILTAPNVAPPLMPLELFTNAAFLAKRDSEFLTFYRVAEFFFARVIRDLQVEKFRSDPRFSDISVEALRSLVETLGVRFEEGAAMKAILHRIFATDAALLDELKRHYELRGPYLGDKLGLQTSKTARADVAKHLYDLRCGLVHAKEGRVTMRPTGQDAARLAADVTVMEIIATRLLSVFAD